MADLGCGRGELGRLLLPALGGGVVHGFDADPEQVQAGRALAREQGLSRRLRFEEADARSVPADDGAFDLVCCQALLTHVARPQEVLGEMVRLTRPGGWVAVLEPDLPNEAVHPADAEFAALRQRRFEVAADAAGALGLGSWRVASRLATELTEAGLDVVEERIEPGALTLAPPYDADAEALRDAVLRWESEAAAEAAAETLAWLAGEAGATEDFSALEAAEREQRRARATALRRGTWRGVVQRPMAVVVARRAGSV